MSTLLAHPPAPEPETIAWDPSVDAHQRLLDFLAGSDLEEVPPWRAG
ncbi:hypothetical protein [Actinokineospora inagensis]|nr:hypothetical protein [Actinokineospora inagensis]